MAHVRSCPHECKACKLLLKKIGRWFTGAWQSGGCVVCGFSRGIGSWACNECWNQLSHGEQTGAQIAINQAVNESTSGGE